jgi:pilus assembly protein FimV
MLPTMHVTNRPKIVKLALNTLTAAVASAVLMSSAAYAAGLGKLTVLSSLGQPLRAEIELTAVTEDEARNLVAKLAPPEAFRLANIEFNPALMSLRFNVEQRNGRQFIRVSSTQPLNEPFVDMLLELTWDNGKLVREYTFLLDPAELKATQPAQAAVSGQPVPAAASQSVPAASQPARPAPSASQPAAPRDEATEVKVRPGDTLGKIAARVKPAEVSLDMMLVALYRANPDAFLGNNMNRLKTGTILTIPDAEAIKGSGGAGEARGVVIAHAADFNAYRSKLAGQVAAATAAQAPEAAQSATGKIAAKVEERPTAVSGAKDQLKLSKATTGNAAGANTGAAEDRIAKEQQLAEATARVRELEKNVSDLEKLMALKGKTPPAKAPLEAPVASAPLASAPAASEAVVASAPAPKKAAALKPAKKPAKKEPGIMDMIMDNMMIIGGAALAILLGTYAVISRRRKPKATAKAVVEPSILGAPSEQAHTLFAETGGQSVDTNNSVFNSSFAPSASQLDTNEVDPVAEADVYIAYGRDAQAEEILKEALRTHPERIPVRLKLLEIYAARKDSRAFESQATEVYSMTKGQGDEWAQAAALGLTIDPTNPLYAGAAAAPAFPSDPEREQQAMLAQELQASSAMDMDLGMDTPAEAPATPAPTAAPAAAAAEDHSLDFDLGGLSFAPGGDAPAPAAPAAPVAAAAAEPLPDLGMDLDLTAVPTDAPSVSNADMSFDLSFDTPPAASDAPAGNDMSTLDSLSLDTPAPKGADEFAMADLAKEFDLPSTASASASSTPVSDPLADLDAMNFDIPAVPAAEAPAAAAADNAMSMDFGLDLPSLGGEEPTPAPTAAAAAMDFDMSSIDLDLPATPAPEAAPANEMTPAADLDLMAGFDLPSAEVAAEAAVPPSADASLDDLALPDMDLGGEAAAETATPGEMSAQHMEMETKLDLAIAYQEIGDKEGARELIEEVIKGGSPEQVAKANELRVQLA